MSREERCPCCGVIPEQRSAAPAEPAEPWGYALAHRDGGSPHAGAPVYEDRKEAEERAEDECSTVSLRPRFDVVPVYLATPAPEGEPGLREWVLRCLDHVAAYELGAREAYMAVIREIDRRTPAPSDGEGR